MTDDTQPMGVDNMPTGAHKGLLPGHTFRTSIYAHKPISGCGACPIRHATRPPRPAPSGVTEHVLWFLLGAAIGAAGIILGVAVTLTA